MMLKKKKISVLNTGPTFLGNIFSILGFFSSRLTPILGIQKHSQENKMFTQFIDTLLEELHLKNEDLENLTIIFKTSC